MVKAQRSPSSCLRELRRAVVVCAGAAGIVLAMPLQAASFGHARLASAPGQPLGIDIPVSQLTAEDAVGLRVVPAPEAQWTQAGLVPPVPLASIRGRLLPGPVPGSLRLHVSSAEIFNQPIADLLLDVHTASGVHRYQVSVLARDGGASLRAPEADPGAADVAGRPGRGDVLASSVDQPAIRVRKGDTMFAIARRHAVQGVSVYQMMIALQRANPRAFIENNLNLVRAGAELRMPDRSALTAISDREARRLFHEQVVAFQRYREGRRGQPEPAPEIAPVIEAAEVPEAEPAAEEEVPVISNIPPEQVGGGDRLRLSSGRVAPSATTSAQQETPVAGALFNQSAQSAQSAVAELGNSVAQNLAAGISRDAHAADAVPGDATPAASGAPVAASPGDAGRHIAAPAVSAEGVGRRTGDPVSTAAATAVAAAEAARAATGEVTPADAAAPAPAAAAPAAATPAVATPAAAVPTAAAPAAATDDGTADDDRVALEKETQDARDRVSLLEENVRNLNKALQSQGEAAKDLVVDGAIGLRQSLTEMATAVTEATIGDEPGDDDTAEKPAAAVAGEPLTTPSTPPAASAEASRAASESPTAPSPVAGAATPDAAPATAPAPETTAPVTVAPASGPATDKPAPAASAAPAASQAPATASPSATGQASRTPLLREWLLPGMAGIIGLLLLVIVWLLRRATRMRGQAPDHVTPEMVKERLEGISLDLDDDPRR
ncbi:MAG: FimV/HubP family polar landmark protein [Castellaniella sp.]